MYNQTDTIVALATPQGLGAIAVIRLSGKEAITIVNQIFKAKDLTKQASHTIHFGTIMDGEAVLDEVLVSLFVAPKSYTKENVVEISCHASPYIIQRLLQLFVAQGARLAQAGEFTMRAFLNGGLDLTQAEAVADVIASQSKASHQIAVQQMRGGFSSQLKQLRQDLVEFASLIELELDFSEEDVEFANRDALGILVQKIQRLIATLIASFEQGNVIKNGVPIVIAGQPNVGKSTLLNALLNEERAIVSEIAGTTRDTIEDEMNINGIAFRFIDTAGLRQTSDQIEAIGVERSYEKMRQARLILYLITPDQSLQDIDKQRREIENINIPILWVLNKTDQLKDAITYPFSTIAIAAKSSIGIEELKQAIGQHAKLHTAEPNEVIISNIRHLEALQQTQEALDRVLTGMKTQISSDFIALDIRQALHYLGLITGEVSVDEDILGTIFGKFCIGK